MMRSSLLPTVLFLICTACATGEVSGETISWADGGKFVDCEALPEGVDCVCVVESAFKAAPSAPLTVIDQSSSVAHKEKTTALAKQIKIAVAVKDAKENCATESSEE